jgi:hypothetical protein
MLYKVADFHFPSLRSYSVHNGLWVEARISYMGRRIYITCTRHNGTGKIVSVCPLPAAFKDSQHARYSPRRSWLKSAVACCIATLFAGVAPTPTEANLPDHVQYDPIPKTVVLDGKRLFAAKVLIAAGDPAYRIALSYLTAQADSWLSQGPWSVTNKKITPPGGDKHDYASQAPYWWPSATHDGCPYIQRDGFRNPEVDNYTDHADRASMFQSSYILSLVWYYTGNDKYAIHAGDILRTWFLTPATAMNPNLNHAQIIPCANTGRSIGIIDFSQEYTSVLDAAAILGSGAPGWSAADAAGFNAWNTAFLSWLADSKFGIEESAAKNNHGTFASMQKAGIALFVGNSSLAKIEVKSTLPRIAAYITASGSQPQELARTRSWHYSNFNLVAYTRLAAMGQRVGVDVWGYKGPAGQSLDKAIEFVIPAATGVKTWAYPELDFVAYAASDVVHAGADAGDKKAQAAVGNLQAPSGGDLWQLRPAAEQLDNILGN